VPRPDYRIGLPAVGVWKEVLNTDAEVYDGSGKEGNLGQVVSMPIPSHGYPASATVTIPPLGAVWLLLEPTPDEEQPEPDKVAAGARAAAKQATPGRTSTDGTSTRSAKRPATTKKAASKKSTEPRA
jgi:1,4-alpha-glucan branching enzyme